MFVNKYTLNFFFFCGQMKFDEYNLQNKNNHISKQFIDIYVHKYIGLKYMYEVQESNVII